MDYGGWIADTPGFSVLNLPSLKREELTSYFPDFRLPAEKCKFNDCLHYKEVDCGIKRAVALKQIAQHRYNNYITMLEEVIENERCYR